MVAIPNIKFFSENAVTKMVSKLSVYILVFLLPVFFLPWSANVLDFNKQALLVFLTFIALFSWMVEILISGKVSFNVSAIYVPLGVLLLIVLASSITSLWAYGSFWGWPLATNESFLSVMCLVILVFLVVNIFKKKELLRLFKVFLASWFLTLLIVTLQVFGKFIFPSSFTKSISFNTVGTIFSIGILTAAIMPIVMFLIINLRRVARILLFIYLVLSTFFLIMLNFSMSWWILIIGSALVIILGTLKKGAFETRWLALPMFFLAISILFTLFRLQIAGLPYIPPEIFLKGSTTFDIAKQVLKERPILGSGPGTFVYDFSKFKTPALNLSNFWDIRFENGNSKMLNILSTTGILGILSYAFLWAVLLFYGFKMFLRKSILRTSRIKVFSSEETGEAAEEKTEKAERGEKGVLYDALSSGLFAAIVALTFAFFFYSTNLTLDFAYFLIIASFIALNFGTKREFTLKPSSLPTLVATFAFTLVFILGLGFGILEGQRMMAEAKFTKGMQEFNAGKTDLAIRDLEKAVVFSSGRGGMDLYLRQLSQFYFKKMNDEAARQDIPAEDVSRNVQILMSSSINSAKTATDLNSGSAANWENLGAVYQAMIGIIRESEDWAVKAYDEAIKLDPANPYLVNQKGVILLNKSELLTKDQAAEKEQVLLDAQNQFDKALALKSDYYLPHMNLAILHQLKGKDSEAIKELEQAKNLTSNSNPLVIFQLGLLYYRTADYAKAQKEFERAVFLDPNYANALYFLGLVYDAQGQKQKAIEKFEKVAELNPGVAEVQKIISNLKAGKSALSGIITEEQSVVPPQEPAEEKLPVEKNKIEVEK